MPAAANAAAAGRAAATTAGVGSSARGGSARGGSARGGSLRVSGGGRPLALLARFIARLIRSGGAPGPVGGGQPLRGGHARRGGGLAWRLHARRPFDQLDVVCAGER